MPNSSQFLKGFDIKKGMKLAGYKLENTSVGHNEVERFRKYEYPIKLTFVSDTSNENKNLDPHLLLDYLKTKVSKNRVIKSSYGNPYESNFGTPSIQHTSHNERTVVITSQGHAHRI